MLKLVVKFIVIMFVPAVVWASNSFLVGRWEGAFVRQGAVQLVAMNVTVNGESLGGTFEIPEVAIYEQPIRDLRIDLHAVHLRFNYGPFDMVYDSVHDQLTGSNDKWNPPVQLHLKRTATVPFDRWQRADLSIDAGDHVLAGTLYTPTATGRHPVIIALHGGGDTTRSNWTYRSHVYRLVERGISVFLFDLPGQVGSSGNSNSTLTEIGRDVAKIVARLKQESSVDTTRIGLYGISRGGWVAIKAAVAIPDVAFLVLIEGPGVSLAAQELDGIRRTMTAEDFTAAQVDSAVRQAELFFKLVDGFLSMSKFRKQTLVRDSIGWSNYCHDPKTADDPSIWWWRDNAYDPAVDLARLKIPVIAVYGERDTWVAPETNLTLTERLVRQAGQSFTSVIVPDLGHAVASYSTLVGGEWKWPNHYWAWSYRPLIIDSTVADWIHAR